MPSLGLTDKQRSVYLFIEAYIKKNRRAPTLQEITTAMGARSISSAQKLVGILETKGYVTREKGLARSLLLTRENFEPGSPEDGVQEILIRRAGSVPDTPLARLLAEKLLVDRRFFRGIASAGSCFAVRAGDHAMRPDGIFRGDLVIVERVSQDRIEPGELVVCARRGEFIVRRFEALGSLPSLVASDPSYSTIHPEPLHTQVEGRVIALMRRL